MSWKLPMALVGAVCLIGAPKIQADDPTIEDIARVLQQWKSSWVTLRVQYERRNPGQLRNHSKDPKIREAESLENYYFDEEWILRDDGSNRHTLRDIDGGMLVETEVFGKHIAKNLSFDASYRRGANGQQELMRVRINPWAPNVAGSDDGFIGFGAAFPLRPLFNVARHEWLGDSLLALGTLQGFEDIDGVRCARVSIGICTLWLDPQHGFLPRRYDWEDQHGVGILWSVSEFQRLKNAIWFPKRGTHWFKGDPREETTDWVVTKVVLNESLGPETFAPPQPEIGTRVEDARTDKYYTFGQNRNRRTERAIIEQARQNVPPETVTAQIPFWVRYGWPLSLLTVAIVVLGAGIWLSRR